MQTRPFLDAIMSLIAVLDQAIAVMEHLVELVRAGAPLFVMANRMAPNPRGVAFLTCIVLFGGLGFKVFSLIETN